MGAAVKDILPFASPIASASLGDGLYLTLTSGSTVAISDVAQQCCEHRWITCDDDLSFLTGAVLLSIEPKEGGHTSNEEWGDTHDTMFVDVVTTKGTVTLCTHNDHNGYYGGFDVVAAFTDRNGNVRTFEWATYGWRDVDNDKG